MYNNKYNEKVVSDVIRNNKKFVEESKKMEDEPLSGGFLPFLAGALLPAILPSIIKAVGGKKPYKCECEGKGYSGGSGFGPNTFMDTGYPLSGSGMSAGVKKYMKTVPDVGCGGLDNRVIGGKKRRGRPSKMKGEGIISDVLSSFGLGHPKKKRGRPAKMKVEGVPVLGALGMGKKRGRPSKKGGMMMKGFDEFKEEFKPVLYQGKGKKNSRALIPNEQMHSSNMSGGKSKKVTKRAEVVKKVMKERGINMIQASKAVKAEGLY